MCGDGHGHLPHPRLEAGEALLDGLELRLQRREVAAKLPGDLCRESRIVVVAASEICLVGFRICYRGLGLLPLLWYRFRGPLGPFTYDVGVLEGNKDSDREVA